MSITRLSLTGAWQGALVGGFVAWYPFIPFLIDEVLYLTSPADVAGILAFGLILAAIAVVVGLAVGAIIGVTVGAAAGLALELTAARARRAERVAAGIGAAALAAAFVAMSFAFLDGELDPRWWFTLWTSIVALAALPLVLAVLKETRRVEGRTTP